ncbi:MAG TPA: alpha/beta fold hydrolase [Solimonas sp.]|nr:alpha/beta fold hydrolase [Solimonas sp.]
MHRICVTAAALGLAACGNGTIDGAARAGAGEDPPFETAQATLDAALHCTPFTHPDKPPVLLVHGTFTNGTEQYNWSYLPLLSSRGFDVCAVSYPDRGLGDQQISAEYVANALRSIHAQTGRKVAMIGHSQGASMPRWALKWWPSARAAVEDFVLQAGPNHGTSNAPAFPVLPSLTGMPASFYQFSPDSHFNAAVNAGDETPGDISYTNLYTQFDELVQPYQPVPTAALDFGQDNPLVANILLQDVCPARLVDHVTIGLTDRAAFELTLDAISNPGPASLERAGGSAICGMSTLIPEEVIADEAVPAMVGVMMQGPSSGFPEPHLVNEEPPLKPYAHE